MNDPRPRPRPPAPSKIRPYVITRGRTRASRALGMETLLRTVEEFDRHAAGRLPLPESGRLYRMCRQATSVAELATGLGVTMGVVRVLADDLIREGLLETLPDGSGGVSLALLERVRRGLANLAE